jgi:hypothetical protein
LSGRIGFVLRWHGATVSQEINSGLPVVEDINEASWMAGQNLFFISADQRSRIFRYNMQRRHSQKMVKREPLQDHV